MVMEPWQCKVEIFSKNESYFRNKSLDYCKIKFNLNMNLKVLSKNFWSLEKKFLINFLNETFHLQSLLKTLSSQLNETLASIIWQ